MNYQLEQVFQNCFYQHYRTRLVGGASEPLYQPGCGNIDDHQVMYRQDFFASALHEVAHWCIAGDQRRQHIDYGYWYVPDGRDATRQRQFEQVEVKPQAVEWHFALACGVPFRISADNLDGEVRTGGMFARSVSEQAQQYCRDRLPPRAEQFRLALAEEFGGAARPSPVRFEAESLA